MIQQRIYEKEFNNSKKKQEINLPADEVSEHR